MWQVRVIVIRISMQAYSLPIKRYAHCGLAHTANDSELYSPFVRAKVRHSTEFNNQVINSIVLNEDVYELR